MDDGIVSEQRLFAREAIEQSIPMRFEQQVQQHGARLAIRTSNTSLTYRALNRFANRIAHGILQGDAPHGQPVALLFEQGAALIAAILAVLKSGNLYVPLDSGYPEAQLEHVLADSGASLILTDSANTALAKKLAAPHRQSREVEADFRNYPEHNLDLHLVPDTFAYIYYTSGSTGEPKGVVDDHRNVLHNIMRYTNNLAISCEDRLTLLQSSGFSGAVSNIFCALLNGAALFPFDLRREGIEGLARRIVSDDITIYHSVPTIFQRLLRQGYELPSLRVIRLEGDRATPRDADLFQRHFGANCQLVNGLGATETGISRQYFVGAKTVVDGTLLPIGYATEDMQTLLLDERGEEVAEGEMGEIAIRSRYLARGYWRRPKLTESQFKVCPELPGMRVYHSGDLGRLRPDGALEYLGRKDFRRKIDGEWVDLEAIESLLNADEQVQQALVDVRDDQRGVSSVVAYVVPAAGYLLQVSALRQRFVMAKHCRVLMPSVFVILDALPLDANGKIARKQLPAWVPRPEFIAPQTETETFIAGIYASVLGLESVGREDGFYALGGDSLDAAEAIRKLEKIGTTELLLAQFLQATTVAEIATAIDDRRSVRSLVPLQGAGSRRPFFCVHEHSGHALSLRCLAAALGPEQPFYALQFQGRANGDRRPISLQEMALQYLGEIRAQQPSGPYVLGGVCYGCFLALEIARLLRDAGEEVALLALIDPDSLASNSSPRELPWLANQWRQMRLRSGWGRWLYLRDGVLEHGGRIWHDLLFRWWRLCLQRGWPLPGLLRHTKMQLSMAWRHCNPQPYAGSAVTISAQNGKEAGQSWRRLVTGGVSVQEIPGSAAGMLREPQVGLLARELSACLADSPDGSDGKSDRTRSSC